MYALAGVSQLTEALSHKPRGIPSQGTRLGCGFGPLSGRVQEATNRCFPHINVSLLLSLSSFLCLE